MKEDYMPLDQCKKGYLYKIDSRNLSYGVYDGKQGFIGIREKFGSKYLFTEFHYDQGAPYGTVFPEKELEQVPDRIEICEYLTDPEKDGRPMNKQLFDYLTTKEIEHRLVKSKQVRENNIAIWTINDPEVQDEARRIVSAANLPFAGPAEGVEVKMFKDECERIALLWNEIKPKK